MRALDAGRMDSRTARRDTVLVVDDTPEALGLLTDMLDGAGYTVLIATDGESALRLVDQITPDLVLMDALMPGLDGFETCRRLKLKAPLAHLPVIFMTGLAETEHVVQGLAAGGVDYVTKPIILEELLARIRVHLANARVAQGPNAALDASGRFLLATDLSGQIKWCTRTGERKTLGLQSAPKQVPAVKIGRLAVDSRIQAQGIGTALIGLSYQKAVAAMSLFGCRLLTVDAYPDKVDWYEGRKFVRNSLGSQHEHCRKCRKPIDQCPHCREPHLRAPHKTVSMRFDLKAEVLPTWASPP